MKAGSRLPGAPGAGDRGTHSITRKLWTGLLGFFLLSCVGSRCALAQAAASSGQAPTLTSGEESEAANRKALEVQAGKNAAKLMLRSVPDEASVRIGGKPVGRTPLLLIVQPGVYVVEMEGGTRVGYGRQQVDLLPREAREVVLSLQPRYPAYLHLSLSSHR